MATMVYRYGVASWWRAPDWVMEQLRLAHDLGNALVEAHNRHAAAKDSHWSSFPDIADHERALADAIADVTLLREQVDELRQKVGQARHQSPCDKVPKCGLCGRRARRNLPNPTRDDLRAAQAELRPVREQLAAARKLVTELKAQRREAISGRLEESTAALVQLELARREEVKALYADYCQQRGLHWASYGAVVKHHDTARDRVKTARAGLAAARLKFHRWDGTGAMTVQLQRQAYSHGCAPKGPPWPCATQEKPKPAPVDCPQRVIRDPARTPALLASGEGKWRNVFQLRPWSPDAEQWKAQPRSGRRGRVAMVLSGGRQLQVPVLVDRVLPADADVPLVELVRSDKAGQPVWHLCVTAQVPDSEPADRGLPTVAAHLGWRRLTGGDIRVGVLHSTSPLPPPPPGLLLAASTSPGRREGAAAGQWRPRSRPYVAQVHGGWEVRVPAAMWDLVGRPESIQGYRDDGFNKIRDRLVAWIEEHPDHCDSLELEPARVRAWRSPRQLAARVRRWAPSPHAVAAGAVQPTLPREFEEELLPELVEWQRRDTHLYRYERGERRVLRERRDDVWRQIASWLSGCAARLVLADEDYRQIRRRPAGSGDQSQSDVTVEQEQKVRARSAFVAPGLLRQTLAAAAAREGVQVVRVSAAGLTRLHRECGHTAGADPQYAQQVLVSCPGCGGVYDQDENAVGLMLDRERSGGEQGER